MKVLYLVLPLLSSLAIAQSLVADKCQCPQVKCRATNAFENCRCINRSELECKRRCPKYVPTRLRKCSLPQQETTPTASIPTVALPLPTDPILGFPLPILPLPLPRPRPLVLPLPDVPLVEGCECEERMCIMSFPQGCHCQWNNRKACYDKCGGVSPGINTCPALPPPVVPEPVEPEPTPEVLPLPDLPSVPGCECEEMMCIQSFPESCHCAWGIAKNCYDKCGGKSPGINTCPSRDSFGGGLFVDDGPVKRAAAPEPQTSTVPLLGIVPSLLSGLLGGSQTKPCKYEDLLCVQSWPASCYCANANKQARYTQCGGPAPVYQTCTDSVQPGTLVTKTKTVTLTTTVTPTPTPSSTLHKVQVCGGGRGNTNPPCPTGFTCMNDPYKKQVCGLECDGTGICVEERLCGGFAGFKCKEPGQVCLDDPRDSCSPATGGADCGGLCFWPPSLRAKA